MQETRTKASVGRIIRLDVKLTGSILKHALHERDRTAQCVHAGERSKDARAGESLVGRISGDVDPGKLIAHGDGEVWKCLVVAQQFIETRMNVFDEPALQQKRLPLCFAFQNVEIGDNIQHGLLSTAQICAWNEVTGDTVRQAEGLADVQDLSRRVLHQIDPRNARKRPGLVRKTSNSVNPSLQRLVQGWLPRDGVVLKFRDFR